MKKAFVLLLIFSAYSSNVLAINMDGKFWDWSAVKTIYNCKPRMLEKDRGGFEMKNVKMQLGKKDLYIFIEGKSVTGKKIDKGEGVHKTSMRISFKASQSPLNRVRIAQDPSKPAVVKISYPSIKSKYVGGKGDKRWAMGKYGSKYAYEFKIPVYKSEKGLHVGVMGGPMIRISKKYEGTRNSLSDVLINTVDMKTHRLVDTVEFTIKKGEL